MTATRLFVCCAALIGWAAPGSAGTPADTTRPAVLAFISDTQAPLIFEEVRLRPENNTRATSALFADILRERPAHVFLLGDLVALGFYDRSWEAVDAFLDSLRSCGIRADAVTGNHEVMLFPREGERNFLRRFPGDALTGYARTVDSVAVVMLNSNFNRLGEEGASRQQRWYAAALDSLERDSSVAAIIVCCHHSPYSNSAVTGSSAPVEERFVPPFISSRKARLFLSGHAHASEHFRRGGKDFLVIGGGGGLSHPLETGPLDDLTAAPRPHFHYLLVRREGAELRATIRALSPDLRLFQDIPVPLIPAGADGAR